MHGKASKRTPKSVSLPKTGLGRRVKLSPGQLPLFVEREFDSRSLLVGLYDFKTCSRNSDGSFYGTADSNQCRIGSEVSIDEIKGMMAERGKKVSADAAAVLSGSFSGDLSVTPASKADINDAVSAMNARAKELEDKLNSNADVTKEIESFITERQFIGDTMTARSIVVGMEDATPKAAANDPAEYTKFLAEKMAESEYRNNNPSMVNAANYAQGEYEKAPFHDRHTKLLTAATGQVFSPQDMTAPGGSIAQLELRSVPAPMARADRWMLGKVPAVANNPSLNAKVGDRRDYEKNYDDKMAKNVSSSILKAARGNPNLETVVMSMGGSGRPTANKVMLELAEQSGARHREFKYSPDGGRTTFTGRIVDPTGKGKPLLFDYGASASSRQFQSDKGAFETGKIFRSETAKLLSGQTTSTSGLKSVVQKNTALEEKRARRAANKSAKTSGPPTNPTRRSAAGGKTKSEKQAEAATKRRVKAEKEVEKKQKQLKEARAKRDRYKPGSAMYKKNSDKVNQLLTEQRKIKESGGLI